MPIRFALTVAAALIVVTNPHGTASAAGASRDLFTVAGGGAARPHDGLPAAVTDLSGATVAALPGDGYLVGTQDRVWRVDAQGTLHRVAGTDRIGYTGDGGPAALAEINVDDLATLPGGGLLILDEDDQRVRMVDPSGTITTVAGGGTSTANGIPATQAALDFPDRIAALPGGGFVIGDDFDLVREVGPDGRIRTLAGGGEDDTVHGQPATAVNLDETGLAALSDGSVLVAEEYAGRIDRIAPDGTIRVALHARDIEPSAITTLPDGGYAFFDRHDPAHRIWEVSATGARRLVAGGGPFAATAPAGLSQAVDGGPPTSFDLPDEDGLAALSDGGLLVGLEDSVEFSGRVAYVAPADPQLLAVGLLRDHGRVFGHGRRASVRVALTQPATVTVGVAGHTLTRTLPAGRSDVRLPARLPLEPDLVTVTATDAAGRQATKRVRVFPVGLLPIETAQLVAGAVIAHSGVEECDRLGAARVDCRLDVQPERCREVTVSYVRERIRWGAFSCEHPPPREPRGRPLRRRDWVCEQGGCPPPSLFRRVGEAAIIPSD